MHLTTKVKLRWLENRKLKFKQKVDGAYAQVKREIVDYLRSIKTEPDAFQKYLAQAVTTDDVLTFIAILEGIIKDSKECKDDPLAKVARTTCRYIIFRINYLSGYTLRWTMVKVQCPKCGHVNVTNFLYTDKLCEACGNIIL